MKKIVTVLAILFFAGISAVAQDVITKRNGEDILAIVSEIGENTVKYRRFDNPNGPVYTISAADILMIRYQNGTKDIFEGYQSAPSPMYPTPNYTEIPADIMPGMKYKDLKKIYDTRQYREMDDDPHSPFWCGFGSFLIPGLGQVCCDEWGRGLLFFAGSVLFSGMSQSASRAGNGSATATWSAANFALYVWSIVDARKVAKTINMYYQDMKYYSSIDVNLYPNLVYNPAPSGAQFAPGLTLAIRF